MHGLWVAGCGLRVAGCGAPQEAQKQGAGAGASLPNAGGRLFSWTISCPQRTVVYPLSAPNNTVGAIMHLTKFAQRMVTLYTRPNCGLCVEAKNVLRDSWEKSVQKFDYSEVDITLPENKQWYDLYAFDVPVVHVDDKQQLMHRISMSEVLKLVDEVSPK